jgi:hypothetical protein
MIKYPCPKGAGCDGKIEEERCRCRGPTVYHCDKCKEYFMFCEPHNSYYPIPSSNFPHEHDFPDWDEEHCCCKMLHLTEKKPTRRRMEENYTKIVQTTR